MSTPPPRSLAHRLAAFNAYLSEDLLGGPRLVKMATVINLQKGGSLLFVGFLMWLYGNGTAAAWTYLALHGSYGLIWLLKDAAFPDPKWEKRVTIAGALAMWGLVLGPYWVAPFLLISGVLGPRPEAPLWLLSGAVILYAVGVVTMTSADVQKHFTLKLKRGLITDGMFKRIRHPNYLGEMMIYASFALVVRHWIPWAILAWVWTQVFLVNMLMKEASMSRYPEWASYRARTGMLLPRLFASTDATSASDPREPAASQAPSA